MCVSLREEANIPLQTQNTLETAVVSTLQALSLFTQLPIPKETDTELGQD